MRPRLAGEAGLLLRAHGADHPRAEAARDLAEQQAHAAGRGVDQAGVARTERVGAGGEEVRGEALEHDGGGDSRVDLRRQRNDALGRGERVFRVAARSGSRHATLSPGRQVETPSPTRSTTPAASRPGVNGRGTG